MGARVRLEFDDEDNIAPLIKTVRAGDGYLSQSSLWLHFGLGAADQVRSVIVDWPGSGRQQWNDVEVDRAYELIQGEAELRPREPRSEAVALAAAELPPTPATDVAQLLLSSPLPLPPIMYRAWETSQEQPVQSGQPRLVLLWASWCAPCLDELRQWSDANLRSADVDVELAVLALNVDELTNDESTAAVSEPQRLLAELGFSQRSGRATAELLDTLQLAHNQVYDAHRSLPLPCSFLIDGDGNLAAIYKGPVHPEMAIKHLAWLSLDGEARRERSVPFAGRWFGPAGRPRPTALAWTLLENGMLDQTLRYVEAKQAALQNDDQFALLMAELGNRLVLADDVDRAVAYYRASLAVDSKLAVAYLNLGIVQLRRRQFGDAEQSLREALRTRPDYASAHYQLGLLLLQTQRLTDARESLARAVALKPNERGYRIALANVAMKLGDLDLAGEQLEVAVAADQRDATAWAQMASLRLRQERQADAIQGFGRAVELRPDWPQPLDSLAWLLATAHDSRLRDPRRAISLAERATRLQPAHPQQAKWLDTLAATYAAAGRYDDAVRTAEQAEQLARRTQQHQLAAGIAQRLKLYRSGRPLVP